MKSVRRLGTVLVGAVLWAGGCGPGETPPDEPSPSFVYAGLNARGFHVYTRVADGSPMVLVPSGPYPRRPYEGTARLRPTEEADVPAYLIDLHEVTNAQFARFLNATGMGARGVWEGREVPVAEPCAWGLRRTASGTWEPQPGYAGYPAVGVTGWGALLYARWAGVDLPDPDQWMKAAGGVEGRLFPWGGASPTAASCNWYGAGHYATVPVGAFPAGDSPVGCRDMAGNVYERVRLPARGGLPVMIKGGAWVTAHPLNLRVHDLCMQPMHVAERSVGFRCAVAVDVLARPLPPPAPGRTFAEGDRPAPAPPLDALPPPAALRLARSLAEGLRQARERNCPILLCLHYDTCGQCDRTRAQVLSDPLFIAEANERCVVVVGQHPHDAEDAPHPSRPDGACSLWPALDCAAHEAAFFEGVEASGGFRISPGHFILTPRDPPAGSVLIGEEDLPKSGHGTSAHLEAIRAAQERLGPGLTFSQWRAVTDALRDLGAERPGAVAALAAALAGLDARIPLVAEARARLSAAVPR